MLLLLLLLLLLLQPQLYLPMPAWSYTAPPCTRVTAAPPECYTFPMNSASPVRRPSWSATAARAAALQAHAREGREQHRQEADEC